MAFNGIKEIFSSATNNFSSPKSSSKPPLSGTPVHGYGFPNSRHKNLLRLSSSLQDFSAYNRLDPEDGNFTPENSSNNNNSSNSNQHLTRENGGITFSKEKPPSSSSQTSVRRKWSLVITVLLCLLLLAFVIYGSLYLYSNWAHGSARFYIVLDCGSTGTRVYVYQASINHKKTTNLPILLKSVPEDLQFQKNPSPQSGRAYNRMETEPGFDKLVHNSSGLKHAIKPLLKWAEKQIPKHAHKTTSVFLYATAGVRRLPSTDSDWLLKNAWSIIKHSSFLCKKDWIKIISGMEEAYYGWIALNYYTNVLGSTPKLETFGALDLGGSSLQVTFESRDYTNNETSLNLKIGQLNHHLSAYSLAGYGLNDAFEKSVIYLLKKNPQPNLLKGKAVIKHPCLQSGYKEIYICSQCQAAFQSNQSNRRKILENSGKSGKSGIPVQLIGAPKWDECSALAKITVNSSEWSTKSQSQGVDCDLYPCALQSDLHLPRPTGQFYAMSGFYVVYRFFNLSSDAALDDVIEKGREFCEKTWDSAKKSVPAQPFIEQYCFRAPYIVLLLREGLHITDKQVNIGSGGITWTTGVALLEAGNAISTINNNYYILFKMKSNPYIVFGILFGSLCVVVFALSCAGNCGPQFFRRFYLPLFRHNSVSGNSISSPFNFRRWSPIISGEGRVKMPLSPVASAQNRAFGPDIQLAESSLYKSSSSVSHSFSSSSLGQAQFDSTNSFYPGPHRGQMRLQSRRSQSREDLSCSIADAHLVKV